MQPHKSAQLAKERDTPNPPEESYSRRLANHAWKRTMETLTVELIASTVVGVVVGALASGFSWSGALYGALSFLGVLLFAFIIHLLLAPRDLDKQATSTIEGLRTELTEAQAQIEQDGLEKKRWEHTATNYENEINLQRQQRELADTRAAQYETERNELTVKLKDQASIHKVEVRGLQDAIEKQYREYHDKLIAHLNERSKLKGEVLAERFKNTTPNIYAKVKEAHLKYTSDGLVVTLLALVGNVGAETTLQPFGLRYSFSRNDQRREREGLLEGDVKDFCILRKIDKPLWPSMSREEVYEPLNDLSESNLEPLERHRFHEGWLRFRFPNVIHDEFEPLLMLDIRDATDSVHTVEVKPPWPQSGTIRLTKNLRAEWDEAIEKSKREEAEESDQEK